MDRERVKERVVNYINLYKCATYKNIERVLDNCKFEWKGDLDIPYSKDKLCWCGWNEEADKLVKELLEEKLIKIELADDHIMFCYGMPPAYPRNASSEKTRRNNWQQILFKPFIQASNR